MTERVETNDSDQLMEAVEQDAQVVPAGAEGQGDGSVEDSSGQAADAAPTESPANESVRAPITDGGDQLPAGEPETAGFDSSGATEQALTAEGSSGPVGEDNGEIPINVHQSRAGDEQEAKTGVASSSSTEVGEHALLVIADADPEVEERITPEQLLIGALPEADTDSEVARKLAVLEAIIYVTDEPLSADQIAKALGEPLADVRVLLDQLVSEYSKPHHGLTVREVAGGYKITTKPEFHEPVRTFVRNLNPPLKLSLAALETLAVIAYKQPITAPEIMEIRGVQGAGVLKTLIDRKLITTAGRKNVVGKPILYKTTKEFLVQFGLKDLQELPSLKEFEELRRMAFADTTDPESEPASDVVDGEPVSEETR